MISAKIIQSFQITGRGIVVQIDEKTDLPIGRCIKAIIHQHDGSTEEYDALKEWLLRRSRKPIEDEAFLIVDATSEQVPLGGLITLQIEDK